MNRYHSLILLSIYSSSFFILAVVAIPFLNKHTTSSSSSSSGSHPSSLLLQHHRTIYTNRRPHDSTLYDILNVAPNATLAEIQKSWRRKSLAWHPDKVALRRRRNAASANSNDLNHDDNNYRRKDEENDEEYARNQLQKIQHAYEILSDDHNRLLYHKYGLIGGTDAAVQLLTGRAHSSGNVINGDGSGTTAEQIRLLELMGYHHRQYPSSSSTHEQRIHTLTTTITEYLRPLVEGTISQETFAAQIHSEMNRLKKSPLGAQILRCVGRAYKVEGWRVLRQMREEKYRQRRPYPTHHYNYRHSLSRRTRQNKRVDDVLQDSWRNTKHYASAAYASGKLVLMEQKLKKLEEEQMRQKEERQRQKRRREEEDRLKRIQGRSEGDEESDHVFSSNIGSLSDDEEEDEGFDDIGSLSDNMDNEDINSDLDDDMMMFSSSESEDSDDHDEIEFELQHIQNQKAYTALLSLHQMEALWKVTKIELDRTVREACRWILAPTTPASSAVGDTGGWYAFCPSEQSPYHEDWEHYPPPPPPPPPPPSHQGMHHHQHRHHNHRQEQHQRSRRHTEADGWVGLNGQVVPMEVGRLRAAAAMVLVGDIMVQCSKEGTAWKKKR